MKKIFSTMLLIAAIAATSCSKDEEQSPSTDPDPTPISFSSYNTVSGLVEAAASSACYISLYVDGDLDTATATIAIYDDEDETEYDATNFTIETPTFADGYYGTYVSVIAKSAAVNSETARISDSAVVVVTNGDEEISTTIYLSQGFETTSTSFKAADSSSDLTLKSVDVYGVITDNLFTAESLESGEGYFNGVAFTSVDGSIKYYAESSYGYTTGFSVSNNYDLGYASLTSSWCDYTYQFYALGNSTAAEEGEFAIGYYAAAYEYNGYSSPEYCPTIEFATEADITSIKIIPSALGYTYVPYTAASMTLTISGYSDLDGSAIATQNVELFDSSYKTTSGWQTIMLNNFDDVKYLVFSMKSDDAYAPTYFCIGDISGD